MGRKLITFSPNAARILGKIQGFCSVNSHNVWVNNLKQEYNSFLITNFVNLFHGIDVDIFESCL